MRFYKHFTSAYTEDNLNFYSFAKAEYNSESSATITIDLLNFLKVVKHFNLSDTELWDLFAKERPVLAELLLLFPELEPQPTLDATAVLGSNHGMTVDLVNVHNSYFIDSNAHKRATWRVKCPLSIAVQILRHRAGSFNMVSGRYRTITQEMISLPDDIASLFDRINEKRIAKNNRKNDKRVAKGKPTKLPNLKNKEKATFRESIMEAGEPPVILDTFLTKITKNQLQKFVFSKGYFDSKVRDSVVIDVKNKRAKTFYMISQSKPYTIQNIDYKIEDPLIEYFIFNDTISSLLKHNASYDVDVFQKQYKW
jgi:hypothetical protein